MLLEKYWQYNYLFTEHITLSKALSYTKLAGSKEKSSICKGRKEYYSRGLTI